MKNPQLTMPFIQKEKHSVTNNTHKLVVNSTPDAGKKAHIIFNINCHYSNIYSIMPIYAGRYCKANNI